MPRVVHFEIHADQPERAQRFYAALFGWQFQKWQGPVDYWTVTTGPDSQPGINGGLVPRRPGQPGDAVSAYVCTVQVERLDETVAAATRLGGQVALPRMPIPGVGWLAYCKDPEGNIFGVMQPDATAKPEGR